MEHDHANMRESPKPGMYRSYREAFRRLSVPVLAGLMAWFAIIYGLWLLVKLIRGKHG